MTPTHAQDAAHMPAAGTQARQAILDAARKPVDKELGVHVQFVVKQLRALDGWAFLHATMQGPGGQPVDYRGTRYEDADTHGAKSDKYAALLKQHEGGWQVQAYSVGPTDMVWADWSATYGAPAALFESPH